MNFSGFLFKFLILTKNFKNSFCFTKFVNNPPLPSPQRKSPLTSPRKKIFLFFSIPDLLPRLLSFVTQFKYISLSNRTDHPSQRNEEKKIQTTDRYKTNYTNLVKRIALALKMGINCQGFALMQGLLSAAQRQPLIGFRLSRVNSEDFLSLFHFSFAFRVWLICFIFKLIWIDLNLLIYNLLCQ